MELVSVTIVGGIKGVKWSTVTSETIMDKIMEMWKITKEKGRYF